MGKGKSLFLSPLNDSHISNTSRKMGQEAYWLHYQVLNQPCPLLLPSTSPADSSLPVPTQTQAILCLDWPSALILLHPDPGQLPT